MTLCRVTQSPPSMLGDECLEIIDQRGKHAEHRCLKSCRQKLYTHPHAHAFPGRLVHSRAKPTAKVSCHPHRDHNLGIVMPMFLWSVRPIPVLRLSGFIETLPSMESAQEDEDL